jgi:hypothetical protein
LTTVCRIRNLMPLIMETVRGRVTKTKIALVLWVVGRPCFHLARIAPSRSASVGVSRDHRGLCAVRHLLFSTVGCVVLLLMVQVALPGSVGLGETLVTTILFASIAVAFAYIRANGLAATERAREIAEKMESQARSYADEIARSEVRYATLFSDMNHAHAEQDISEAKRMIDEAKANGATSFERLAASNPEFIDRCLAAVKVNRVNDALLNMMGYADHAELVAKPPTENAVDSRRVMQEQLHAMFDGRHHFASTATLIGKDNRKVTVAVGINVPDDWSVSLSTPRTSLEPAGRWQSALYPRRCRTNSISLCWR